MICSNLDKTNHIPAFITPGGTMWRKQALTLSGPEKQFCQAKSFNKASMNRYKLSLAVSFIPA